MAYRPTNHATKMLERREAGDLFSRETFKLPVEAARNKAREILNQDPQDGYSAIVERWQQLPDGKIEFTMLRLRTAGSRSAAAKASKGSVREINGFDFVRAADAKCVA